MDPGKCRDLLSGRAGETPGLDGRLRGPEVDRYEVTAGTGPATGATLDAGPASPQAAGTAITLSAAGAGGSGIYEYQFYIKGPTTR